MEAILNRQDGIGTGASVSIVWLCSIAPLTIALIPLLLPALQAKLALDASQIGMIASADFLGASAATISLPLWLRRIGPKYGSIIGLTILIGATIATIFADRFGLLAVIRVVAGLGAGMVLSSGITVVAASSKPARIISAIQVLQLLVAGAALSAAGHLLAVTGLGVVLSLIVAISLLSIPATFLLPGASVASHRRSVGWPDLRPSIPVLIGILLYFASVGMLTSFAGKLGLQQGLDLSTAGFALAIGTLGALPGSALASIAENRRRELAALIVASGFQAVAILVILNGKGGFGFVAAYLIIQVCITVIAPLQVATLVARDQSGRAVEGLAAMQTVGQAVGPLAASLLIGTAGVDGAYYLGMVLVVGSAALMLKWTRAVRAPEG